MKDNLVLIGMMGSGKTTCAALLEQKLGLHAVDTDVLIEARVGLSIPEIFSTKGEEFFRDEEWGLSEELALERGLVIACGGGLPLNPSCIGSLKYSGTVVFLNRDPGEIYSGVSMAGRPLAQGGREAFLALAAAREPIYRDWADVVVEDFSTPEATVNAILEGIK